MRTLKNLIAAALFFSCVSCAEVQHLDQALTLQAYSNEQDSLAKEVARRDALTEKLFLLVKSGRVSDEIRTSVELRRKFGDPVLVVTLPEPVKAVEWLYRYQVKYLSSPKVYVMVNPGGTIQGFRYEESSGK